MRGNAINGLTKTVVGYGKRPAPKISIQDLEKVVK